MPTWVRDNGLVIALMGLFLASLGGQVITGFLHENDDLARHGQAAIALADYLRSGAFLSALFENWESEFLQMWAFVMLTAYLFQRGSPESKDPDKPAPQDRDPAKGRLSAHAPAALRAGRLARTLYSHSLGLALAALFVAAFVLHWINSYRAAVEQAMEESRAAPGFVAYLGDAGFWFESFQNWQSEFLSTAVLVVLAIFLRERGSPESKPVAAPHSQTGTD